MLTDLFPPSPTTIIDQYKTSYLIIWVTWTNIEGEKNVIEIKVHCISTLPSEWVTYTMCKAIANSSQHVDILCGSNFKFWLVAITRIFRTSAWLPLTYVHDPIYLCKEWRCLIFQKRIWTFTHAYNFLLEVLWFHHVHLSECSPLFWILMTLYVLNWQWNETLIYLKKKRKRNNKKNWVTNRLFEPFQDVVYLASHCCHMLMGLHSTYTISRNQLNGDV